MTDLRSLTEQEMTDAVSALGEKAFRGRQLFEWVHGKQASSLEEMTNLPAKLREKLNQSIINENDYDIPWRTGT